MPVTGSADGVADPVGDECSDVRQVVKPDVLGAALLGGEDPQFAPRPGGLRGLQLDKACAQAVS
jgi:hypothetical protein